MTKQELAIRLLEAITGLEYKKRIQKMIGVPLPEGVAENLAALSVIAAPPGIFSAIAPILSSVWEGGPVHLIQSEEGDFLMPAVLKAKIDFNTAVTHTIVAAVAGFKISVASICFTVAGETNLTLLSDATAISGAMDFGGTNEPRGKTHTLGEFPLQTEVGEAFKITNSQAIQVSGYITYYLS